MRYNISAVPSSTPSHFPFSSSWKTIHRKWIYKNKTWYSELKKHESVMFGAWIPSFPVSFTKCTDFWTWIGVRTCVVCLFYACMALIPWAVTCCSSIWWMFLLLIQIHVLARQLYCTTTGPFEWPFYLLLSSANRWLCLGLIVLGILEWLGLYVSYAKEVLGAEILWFCSYELWDLSDKPLSLKFTWASKQVKKGGREKEREIWK